MTRPIPSTEDLLKLAEAALLNAEALLDDALLLAESGRFPRAHALATLACEEAGKSNQCLRAMWGVSSPKWFWARFNNHQVKLEPVYAYSIVASGERIESERVFADSVRKSSRSAHLRKLHGLYVNFADGMIQVPGEITEQESLAMLNEARTLLDRQKASWSSRVEHARLWSTHSELFRAVFILFIGWVVVTDNDVVVSMIRDGSWSPAMTDLFYKFKQHVEQVGFDTCLTQVSEQISLFTYRFTEIAAPRIRAIRRDQLSSRYREGAERCA